MFNYYKVKESKKTFQEAYEAFNNGAYVRRHKYIMTVYGPGATKESMDSEKFSVDDVMSDDWEIVEVDWDWENKVDDVRDYVEEAGLYLDSRFYDLDKMTIGEIFDRIADACDRETIYNIIMLLKEKGYRFDKK